jgi:dGTPase
VTSIEEVRAQPQELIGYGPEVREKSLALKRFLRTRLYTHERVRRVTEGSVKVVQELFAAFLDDPRRLPPQYQDKLREQGTPAQARQPRARLVADYIAGMTDRYALREHARLLGPAAD